MKGRVLGERDYLDIDTSSLNYLSRCYVYSLGFKDKVICIGESVCGLVERLVDEMTSSTL